MNSIEGSRKAQFEGVVEHLEHEREEIHREVAGLQRKLRDLDNAIATLRQRIDPAYKPSVTPVESRYPADQRYAFISVHWAILHLLSEAKAPMTTAEIAEALTAAGVKTRAANFANNCSAVLTANMRIRGDEEVESIDGAWRLTEKGRNKIAHIVTSPKFRKGCPWISEHAA